MDDVWQQAIERFETERFWDAHEVLEPAWLDAEGPERAWLAGVILLCAALHKTRAMGSPRGGRRNYAKALRHLAIVSDTYAGVDVRELEARVHRGLRDPSVPMSWPWSERETT